MSFGDDFRRFFVRGLAALLPTLITLWLLVWLWNFLWNSIGQHLIFGIKWAWMTLAETGAVKYAPPGQIRHVWNENDFSTKLVGVALAILLVYVVGVFVGNLIGRTMWRLAERAVMRLPLVRAIYPAVKQVTDFILAERQSQFVSAHVVAVQARAQGIWSIGLVTGTGYGPLNEAVQGDMITVFVPSSPTAFSGYVVVAHREAVVELPLTVEEAMRLLVSGGVITPPLPGAVPAAAAAAAAAAAPAAGPDAPVMPIDRLPVAPPSLISSDPEALREGHGERASA